MLLFGQNESFCARKCKDILHYWKFAVSLRDLIGNL